MCIYRVSMLATLQNFFILFQLFSFVTLSHPYLLIVSENQPAGEVIFNASIYKLGSERHYKINHHRSASFVHRILFVDPKNGQVYLKEPVQCNGIHYPNLFTLHIDSTSERLRSINYYSLPLRIFIVGHECSTTPESEDGAHIEDVSNDYRRRREISMIDLRAAPVQNIYHNHRNQRDLYQQFGYAADIELEFLHQEKFYNTFQSRNKRDLHFFENSENPVSFKISEAKQWISETYASFAIPTADRWQKICLKRSQFINSISAFMPKTISQNCVVNYLHLNDPRFQIEASQGDLVASTNVCIMEPLWKVIILFNTQCHNTKLIDSEHRLIIVYHHQEFNDSDIAKRVRRELRNQSPFFAQALYVASVLEECDPGVLVTTVKARDPENSPVKYSMMSLLDSRSQKMFEIDSKLGTVTTKVKLDRELVDVHYFRIKAEDDSFPPRSGTTTLQVNVLDANDHSPVFEMNEYEASIREGVIVGTTVITIKASDQDIGKNAEIEYTIQSISGGGLTTPDEDSQTFGIDGKTGAITTRTSLDRERTDVYTLIVQATDSASPQPSRRSSSASVVVTIFDDNDNYPQFTERTYTVAVNEDVNWAENPVIAHVEATDADQGNNAAIRYAIIGGNTQSQFSIDSLSGDVSLVKPLDYETLRSYRLVIRAQDGGSPSRSNTTQVLVNVKDVNDNAPRFYTSLFQESVSESVPVGYSIVRVQAYDADESANADIKYSISARDSTGGASDQLPVTVDPRSGWIYTTRELDREVQTKFMFHVLAVDHGVPPLSASASVLLTVQDVNDNDPSFERNEYEAVVAEDNPPGTPVASVIATDPDEDPRLHYELSGGNTRGRFSITTQNGRGLITIAQPLDYKQERRYVLTVTASDSGGRQDTATVYVNVSDANNFAPVFENAPYTAQVFEDAPIGTTVLVVSASDNDVGINAQITYTLGDESIDGNEQHAEFIINPQTGAIITTKLLDRETTSGYLLTVTAKDGGNPALSDTTDVEISVSDVNDNYPVFRQAIYTGNILEDALVGTSVVQVSATDVDIGLNGRIKYSLSTKDVEDGSFVMDPVSGVVRTNKGLDRESVAMYQLEAIATDRGTPTLSSSVPINVRIEDVNDNAPTFESDKIIMYIPENSPIGSTVGELHAHDPDEGVNAIVQYSIIGGEDSNSFSLITRPGSEKAELITMTELDYESARKQYDLIIRAASPPLRTDVHVQISVTDVNDNAPVLKDFHVMFNNFRNCFPSGTIGRVPAWDADVTDQLKYRVLSGNNAKLITVNQTTGEIVLSPQLNTNVPKLATMEVSVSDGVNEVKALMQLSVRLVTEAMLLKSITVRLNDMTEQAFLSPLLNFFMDGLAAIIPCPKENIFLFNIQDDTDVNAKILNISFSARRPDVPHEEYYSPQFLQERVYLNRAILARLSTVQVLPFDDNLCVREPCLNYEECVTVLKFGNASGFIHSDTVLFRPIYPVTTFACRCPYGFTGSKEHYLCDTEVNLCYSNPCQNGGICQRREGGYSCICKLTHTGSNCEVELSSGVCRQHPDLCRGGSSCLPHTAGGAIGFDCAGCTEQHYTKLCELRARSFQAGSFLTFGSLKQRHRLHIRLRFATQATSGLLLYNGRYNEKHDFIALEIVDSGLEFSFSLGSNITRTRTVVAGGISDGNWHTVTVNYFNKTATLSLGDCDTELAVNHGNELGGRWACANYSEHTLDSRCYSLTETCHRFLDLTGPLQIGGLPSIPASFQVQTKYFSGCISDLYIDYKFIDLNSFVADNGSIAGCPEKRPFCSTEPCLNGGTCTEGWATYQCDCADGFSGKDCSEEINQAWEFSGDGVLSFNPLLRPIQLPWMNALSVRTRQANAFLMSIQVGQNSSAVVSIKNGNLCYTFNGESLQLHGSSISDGTWHNLNVRWLGTELVLSVDYGQRRTVVSFPVKIQGMYVGKILIGGPDSSIGSLYADYGYFEGCIQDVRVGSQQSLLNRPTVRDNVQDGCSNEDVCSDPALAAQCPSSSHCVATWRAAKCECAVGYVGPMCQSICSISPCQNQATCIEDVAESSGYKCHCNSTEYSGKYCQMKIEQPCPGGWWGHPVCGPCECDQAAGYHPDCNKTNGQCYCKENHYQPQEGGACLPCDCYTTGSFGSSCDRVTGQCVCRTGVIGRRCQDCPNPYAEVTLRGCEVVYNGCPRNYADGVWWPRTSFGEISVEDCALHAIGRTERACDSLLGGWQQPDMFNCTSEYFIELRNQLNQLEENELEINTYVAVKLGKELNTATNSTPVLYGADVLVTQAILKLLMQYEASQHGLALTHSQDKDYIQNLIRSASVILSDNYSEHWLRIETVSGDCVEDLVKALNKYIFILSDSQHDTYTNPFEVVTNNIALGLDVITAESLYGYEPEQMFASPNDNSQYTTERVILPDTSSFLKSVTGTFNSHSNTEQMVVFPKYNNYLQNKNKFDPFTKILIPMSLLGIKAPDTGEFTIKDSLSDSRAVISYLQFREVGNLLPARYDESVIRRWGVDVTIGSPVISVTVLKPEYVSTADTPTSTYKNDHFIEFSSNKVPTVNRKKVVDSDAQVLKKSITEITVKDHENDAGYLSDEGYDRPHFEALVSDRFVRPEKLIDGEIKKLQYKSLLGIPLKHTIRLEMWLNLNEIEFSERSNPQCVHWSTARGFGEWSRVGCITELNANWMDTKMGPIIINCTCNHLSTFAVLVDVLDTEYIPEPSLLEDISSYSCFCLSLPLLLAAWLILGLLRGANTNSNSIHKNLVACVFLAELLYFIALKARRPLVAEEVVCKLFAMALHYLWLATFCWTLVDAIHLHRMLTEMRDVNHGHMRFYYSLGYALPAIIVGLAVGVRADQYGNVYFCWLSIYESVVWSLVGPICILVLLTLFVLIFCVRAAFTLKDHVMGFGNLRTLLMVSVVSLPLLGVSWVLAMLSVAEHLPILSYLLGASVLAHALFCLVGYCFVNFRVRQNLCRSVLRCMGKKVPLLETTSLGGAGSTSSQNISSPASRSALAYRNTGAFEAARRHIGISTSSTTSRSTTKTSSSPYSRSDTHLRHTSTSTSNYNSTSDVPSYLRGFEQEATLHRHRETTEDSERRERRRATSDSDSEASIDGRSLELASSHSSDDDESSNRRSRHRHAASTTGAPPSYLPNITENVASSRCTTVQAPPALNIVTNSQIFPNIQSMYAPRWSSQLPEAYLPNCNVPEVGRWSAETASDNEIHCHKTSSPNPLPNPDITPADTYLTKPHERECQYVVKRQHYLHSNPQYVSNIQGDYLSNSAQLAKDDYHLMQNKMVASHENFHDYGDRYSETEEKQHLGDKYLFPYTAEEDHCGTGNYGLSLSSRMMSPVMINDVNNPGMIDYQHGSRMGSRMGSIMGSIHGSVHGSVCGSVRGGSPNPLAPPGTMLHTTMGALTDTEKDANEETSV